jgi:hypothetical protein
MLKRKLAVVVLIVLGVAAQTAAASAAPCEKGSTNPAGHTRGFSDGPL